MLCRSYRHCFFIRCRVRDFVAHDCLNRSDNTGHLSRTPANCSAKPCAIVTDCKPCWGADGYTRHWPASDDLKKSDPKGNLWQRDTDECCHIRKVLPQALAIGGFDALITGRKRFQTGARQEMDIIEQDSDGRFKVNPLANWQLNDLKTYLKDA